MDIILPLYLGSCYKFLCSVWVWNTQQLSNGLLSALSLYGFSDLQLATIWNINWKTQTWAVQKFWTSFQYNLLLQLFYLLLLFLSPLSVPVFKLNFITRIVRKYIGYIEFTSTMVQHPWGCRVSLLWVCRVCCTILTPASFHYLSPPNFLYLPIIFGMSSPSLSGLRHLE